MVSERRRERRERERRERRAAGGQGQTSSGHIGETPYVAIPNNAPLPPDLPPAIFELLSKARRDLGWDDDGQPIEA